MTASAKGDSLPTGRPSRARAWGKEVYSLVRRPTASRRLMPSLLIVGGQRCGTTSLFSYLAQHPDVGVPIVKEPQYFSHQFKRGENWYRSLFPLARRSDEPQFTFEATPYYLFHPLSAERASRRLPDARIVVLLRDPVERAYSHWRHSVRLGVEDLGFDEALAAEPGRLAGEEERIRADVRYPGFHHRHHSYVARGHFAPQVARWLQHYPREQVLILRSEEMFVDPAAAYAKVLDLGGLRPYVLPEFRVFTRRDERKQAPMSDATREQLRAEFRGDEAALAEALGVALRWHD